MVWTKNCCGRPSSPPQTLSSRNFLVDSGASVTVFPAPASSSSSGIRLVTANGSAMTCSGSRIIPLQFGSKRFQWTFQLAPVFVPVLTIYIFVYNICKLSNFRHGVFSLMVSLQLTCKGLCPCKYQ